MGDNVLVISILSGIVGVALGMFGMMALSRLGYNKAMQKSTVLIEEANAKAEHIERQAVLDGKTQAYELKLVAEKEIKERKQELQEQENKLLRREDNLNFRDETLTSKEKQIDQKNTQLTEKLNVLEKMEQDLQSKIDLQIQELERVASMNATEQSQN